MQQITRIPLKYWPIFNTLSNESLWKIFKNILGWNEKLNETELIYFNLIMCDINAINKKAWDWYKWKEYWNKWKEYWKLWWRPKGGKELQPKGGLNNPPNIDKNNIDNDSIDKNNIDKKLIYNKEKYFYNFVEDFIDKENPQIKYQLFKKPNYMDTQFGEIDKLIKDWYSGDTIKTILQFIKQDQFWSKNILSIRKLREKDKNWIPYVVRMIWLIKDYKPKIIDLSQYDV